ncbi:unnamed protein product, partial [Brassica rapa subsp. trilocularis]
NLFVSTILKPRTLDVFVVSLDGLSLTRVGSSVNSPAPLSTIYANPAIDVGGTPLRRPDLFLINPCHQPPQTYLLLQRFVNLASDVGGNPLRRPVLNHLFMKMVSDVGGNPLRHPALSHQKLVSLLTGLLPCGAVRTGPEGAIETTSVFLVGEDCLSTSLVTISQLSDFVVEALSTHSNLFMNCPQEDV